MHVWAKAELGSSGVLLFCADACQHEHITSITFVKSLQYSSYKIISNCDIERQKYPHPQASTAAEGLTAITLWNPCRTLSRHTAAENSEPITRET